MVNRECDLLLARYDNGIMEWHRFPEGEEPRVLTGVSSYCDQGKHAEGPSHAKSSTGAIPCSVFAHATKSRLRLKTSRPLANQMEIYAGVLMTCPDCLKMQTPLMCHPRLSAQLSKV